MRALAWDELACGTEFGHSIRCVVTCNVVWQVRVRYGYMASTCGVSSLYWAVCIVVTDIDLPEACIQLQWKLHTVFAVYHRYTEQYRPLHLISLHWRHSDVWRCIIVTLTSDCQLVRIPLQRNHSKVVVCNVIETLIDNLGYCNIVKTRYHRYKYGYARGFESRERA